MTKSTGGGRYLASLRDATGITVKTAAERARVSPGRLAAMEADRVAPRLTEVARLATVYDRSLAEVAEGWREAVRGDGPKTGSEPNGEGGK